MLKVFLFLFFYARLFTKSLIYKLEGMIILIFIWLYDLNI